MDGNMIEREFEDRRPSEHRVKGVGRHEVNIPPLLAAHLRRSKYGQPPRGRVVEFKEAPNMDGNMIERESEDRRPSKHRVEGVGRHEVNIPPLLAAHLRRSKYGQPL
nr:hypothetical protein [Tanacetum cinerariifolium]